MRRLALFFALGLLVLPMSACGPAPAPIPDPKLEGVEGRVKQSISKARQAVEEEPRSALTWGRLGMVLDVHELDPEAIAAYRQAATLDPEDVRWPYFLGRLQTLRGQDPGAAAESLRAALSLRPDYVPAHFRMADALAKAGDEAGAQDAFREALRLSPSSQRGHLGLGQILLLRGEVENALPHLEKAHELEPKDGAAVAALAQALRRSGDSGRDKDRAEDLAHRARQLEVLDSFPDPLLQEVSARGVSSSHRLERAVALVQAGRFSEAIPDLEVVVAIRKDDANAIHELAVAYGQTGQLDKAVEHFRRALQLEEGQLEWRVQLGELLVGKDEPAEALKELRIAREKGYPNPALGALMGAALSRAGNLQQAVGEFEAAAKRAPLPVPLQLEYGSALARLSRFQEAEEQFRLTLAKAPGNPQAYLNLGLTLEAQGKSEEAARAYLEAMEIEPNPMAAQRLEALGVAPP